MIVSILVRRLREARPTITIGFSGVAREEAEVLLKQVSIARSGAEQDEGGSEEVAGDEHVGEVAQEQLARRSRIGQVIEPEMTRAFYVQLADDGLT